MTATPDYFDELFKRLETNAERVEKAKPVSITGLGTLYVRPRLIGERDSAVVAETTGDTNILADAVAGLLCDEKGRRLPKEKLAALASLIKRQPDSVLMKISKVADFDDGVPAEGK